MPPAPQALCPNCGEPLTQRAVEGRKYWHCTDASCKGKFKGTHPTCPTRSCAKSMGLTVGPKGHWFWSCPLDACSASASISGWRLYGTEDPTKKRAKWGKKL